jgi:aspartyl-tRNA(Asn)/glutamyl-tRNA(Gln) amidotransferase subunit A
MSATELRAAIVDGAMTAESAVRETLDLIAAEDARVRAFITVDSERALERARALDRSAESRGRLHGVPIALKDNLCVRGMKTTAGSRDSRRLPASLQRDRRRAPGSRRRDRHRQDQLR